MTDVRIASPTAADCDRFVRSARASRELHAGLVEPPLDVASFVNMLARDKSVHNHRFLVWAGSNLAGVYNISSIIRGPLQSAFLGYYGFAGQSGKGLMTSGLRLVLDEAFGPLALHRLEANIQPHNERSIALVLRCGFRKEGFSPRYLKIAGQWRDHERYAILADEWG